ncbi:hypothetical protein [Pseudomonas frederiksbergensis]|uniref:hypothetical protein n=1 Tax=Pseudomonas frederiksbergensis TaxID=104087 RepID=UPI003D1DC320
MAVRLVICGAVDAAIAGKPCSYRFGTAIDEKTFTIIPVDMHHRNECLPQKNRPAQDRPIRNPNPASEGHIMLIHLLTCLALTAVTLTLFSRFFLGIGHTEEHPS